MSVATSNKQGEVLGASLFAPVRPGALYEALLDVRGFPGWAPGVKRVEILEGAGSRGMVSEWEVSLLGARRKVLSVLEEAEPHGLLRWTYEGPISGYGECVIRDRGDGVLAEFRTQLRPEDVLLRSIMRSSPARGAARVELKRCLARLGQKVCGGGEVRVGPLAGF
ncbi:hypothetical protein GBA65_02425 [Rubrobacter marinus]|uniref:Polyketide cyclase / dehydrase and lipid transport n=1 Tax=Rubrobacter marinus TaxID=2653852 RepID=A0A6G8PSZ0_9ACTN|nr:SRPBCC family protein [Rubrobacter marinus]QIN77550.1 hypothetical protein GBA65_02425 [Rubrobacter marinus]